MSAPAAAPAPLAFGGPRPIRVMVVDDSIVARAMITRILAGADDIEVVAQAGCGRAALAALAQTPVDLILLDLEMPVMGGLEALPALIAASGGARVLVVSTAADAGAEATLTALRLGAADTLLKPAIGAGATFGAALLDRLRRIADVAQPAPPTDLPAVAALRRAAPRTFARPIACVAIGASTGGVHALAALFAEYPEACDAPILITQHLPAPFIPYFASQLTDITRRRVRVAENGMPLARGTILLAPGDASLSLQRTRGMIHARLVRERAASGCLPSVDPMFEAVAQLYGDEAIGVILSGMGRDGVVGARSLVEAGAELVVQDRTSSVVWGMPGAAAEARLADAVLTPAKIAAHIGRRSRGARAWR